ncbi:MAG: hypothetical protein M3131_04975 [Actinomycetota bacterium]|nr:hypothetical protein [Actinomycetota bacterium]
MQAPPALGQPLNLGKADGLGAGPVLAGPSLLFEEEPGGRFAVRLATAGQPTRTLASAAPPAPSDDSESPGDFSTTRIAVAASPARAAYTNTSSSGNARYGQGTTGTAVFSGPLAGPLAQLATCSGDLYPPFSGEVAVDADAVAHTACDGSLVIRNFAPGAPVAVRTIAQPTGFAARDVALAGRYVAYTRSRVGPVPRDLDRTVVADWVAGTESYSLPAEEDFDIDADGTIVVANFSGGVSCATGRLFWYSTSQPVPHPVGQNPCRPGVRIAGGGIAVALDAGGGQHALSLVDLAGRRRDVAALGPPGVQRGDVDFDGSRLSYALADCSGQSDLLMVAATSTEAAKPLSTSCPVAIRSRRLELRSGRRSVRASLACPRGCAGTARLDRRRGRGRRARRVTIGSSRSFRIGAVRCRTAVGIALNRTGRRLVRARRPLRARLVITTTDRAGRSRVKRASVVLSPTRRGGSGTRSSANGC